MSIHTRVGLETILGTVITMLAGAVATVWALYATTQRARINDFKERIKNYDEEVAVTLKSLEGSLAKMIDLFERQERERMYQERGRRE